MLNTSYTMNKSLRVAVTAWYHYDEGTYSVISLWPLPGGDIHRIIFLPQTVLKPRYFKIKRTYCIKKMLSRLLKYS